MTEATMTIQQFGAQVKTKYPAYSQYSDEEIGNRMLQKYPVYKDRVTGTAATGAFAPKAPLSARQQADVESAQKYGAFAPANTENPSAIGEGLKSVANVPTSAFGFVKGAIDFLNPVDISNPLNPKIKIYERAKQIAQEFKGLAGEVGGYGKAAKSLLGELPGGAYESVVPEAARGAVMAGRGAFTGNAAMETEGLETAQRALVNDPVGQIAPFLLAAKGGANVLDRTGLTKGAEAVFDTGVSKVARVVTKPVSGAFGGAGRAIAGATKFAVGQATGLQPETISQVVKTPEAFARSARGTITRETVGREVQSTLSRKASTLAETGEAYGPIREGGASVKVAKSWLDSTIKDLTGLEIKKGRMETSGKAVLREASDVRAAQHLYDLWKPVFEKGKMTADEFLNFRTDLANLSKFERQIGKSQPIESMAKLARGRFNEAYRPQLEGLEVLDKEFSGQRAELSRLSKGLVDRNGALTPNAYDQIANATGKTFKKGELLSRLEEMNPGITEKLKIAKAIDDIQQASGIKVGTYGRVGIGVVTGISAGVIPAVLQAILTSPEFAVPILRRYGLIKNSAAVTAVVRALQSGGRAINQLPNEIPPVLKKEVNAENFPVGMTIKDVSKGIQPFVEQAKSMRINDAKSVFEKLQKTGSAIVAEKPGMRLILKDEGDFIKLGLDTGKLTSTDLKLPEKNFATAEEAIVALKPLYEGALKATQKPPSGAFSPKGQGEAATPKTAAKTTVTTGKEVTYHGTPHAAQIAKEGFKLTNLGKTSGYEGTYGAGVTLSTDIGRAKLYGEPMTIKLKPGLKLFETKDPVTDLFANQKLIPDVSPRGVTQSLQKAGYDGVKVGDEIVVFDPKNVIIETAKPTLGGELTGYRGSPKTGISFGSTEGKGVYIAETKELANFFAGEKGEVTQIKYKAPKKPLVVNEEPLHLLSETEEIAQPIAKGDSVWTRLNKQAYQNVAEQLGGPEKLDKSWNTGADMVADELTNLMKKEGYDAVQVSSGGEKWTVLLNGDLMKTPAFGAKPN